MTNHMDIRIISGGATTRVYKQEAGMSHGTGWGRQAWGWRPEGIMLEWKCLSAYLSKSR